MNMQAVKVSELSGAALDWAVAKCRGHQWRCPWLLEKSGYPAWQGYEESWGNPTPNYSTDWAEGGPILEQEWLDVTPWPNESDADSRWQCKQHDSLRCVAFGPTPLIAAMRCYVASKLGDTVEIPEALLEVNK